MKKIFGTAILVSSLLSSGVALAAEQTVTLSVSGMTCASCPYIVKESLSAVDGVMAVTVSMLERTAVVTYDDAKSSVTDLTNATGNMGFPSEQIEQGS